MNKFICYEWYLPPVEQIRRARIQSSKENIFFVESEWLDFCNKINMFVSGFTVKVRKKESFFKRNATLSWLISDICWFSFQNSELASLTLWEWIDRHMLFRTACTNVNDFHTKVVMKTLRLYMMPLNHISTTMAELFQITHAS